jgi:hypothetical protein
MSAQTGSPPPRPRADAITVLLAVIGVLLLFPGFCSIIVCVTAIADDPRVFAKPFGEVLAFFIGLGLVVSFGGIALLWYARRRRRRRAEAMQP